MDGPDASNLSTGAEPRPMRKGGPKRAPQPASGGAGAYPESVQRLIDELAKLPSVGRRSAERLAFHILKASSSEALALARAIQDVKQRVRHCPICYNLMDAAEAVNPDDHARGCAICRSENRDRGLVMVVEQPKDLIALEQTGMYRGVYHVLMGRISPMESVGPGDLTVEDLLQRIEDPSRNSGGEAVREVILGLNPTMEADGTALYLAQEIQARSAAAATGTGTPSGGVGGVPVTRLARGLPTGSPLEFASRAVLADAIEGRRPI